MPTAGVPPRARPQDLTTMVARALLVWLSAIGLAAFGIVFTTLRVGPAELFFGGAGAAFVYAALLGAAALLVERGRASAGVTLALCALLVATTLFAVVSQLGINALLLGAYGIVIVVAGVTVGVRLAGLFTAACACALAAMYLAELWGLLPGRDLIFGLPLHTRLLAHGLLIGTALLFAWMLARIVHASLAHARSQERRFPSLLAVAADWCWEQDAEYRFTHVSPSLTTRTGIAHEQFIGRTRWELAESALSPAQWAAHRADLDARRPFRDFVMQRSDAQGRTVFVSISGEAVFAPDGAFTGYWGVGRDVTAEIQTQRALEVSETRYRDLFTRSPSPFIIHRGGQILVANQAAARLFGYESPLDMCGVPMLTLNHPESRELSAQRIAALDRMPIGGSVPTVELRLRRADGHDVFAQASVARIDLGDGPASLSIYFDLTERKRAEAVLRRSQAMLSKLFEASPDYITVSDIDNGWLYMVNEGFERMTGHARDDAVGRSALDLGIWADPADRARLVAQVRASGIVHGMPATMRRKDGRLFPVLFSAGTFNVDGVTMLVATARDVTDSEQARLQYEAMFKTASVGIAFTRDRVFQHVNPRFAEMVGWTPEELTGQPGAVVWASPQESAEIGRRYATQLGRGEGVDFEHRLRRRAGGEVWARMRARAIDPRNPGAGGTIWIAEDITDRRAADAALAAAKEAAEAASRAKSAFLANTSHEIRTPLNGLLGLACLALEPKVRPEQQREYLHRIVESAQALAGIISDILDLSKIEAGKLTLEFVDFDLHALLRSVHAAYRELAAGKGLACELTLDPALPVRVGGDPVRVRQIATNFLSNALKFTERGRMHLQAGVADGGRVRIAVTDTGIGVDEATRRRLFTPFTQADESTTRRFGGTGLGLSICQQLALLMDGEVGVHSAPGAGSTFWAELPLPAARAPAAPAREDAPDEEALHGMRVLLVEDNPVNMLIAETLLANWGIEVVQAVNGREAVDAVEREGGRFDAVLMDVHMPVMSGHDATVELRRRYGSDELPIIALTAAALVSEQQQSLSLGMNDFITKPFDAQRLRSALARWGRRTATARRD